MSGLSPTEEVVLRARALADVLGIAPATFAGHELRAYYIMSHMLAVPTIRDNGTRNRYINEIQANIGRLFPPQYPHSAMFIGATGTVFAQMQMFPFWFSHLSMSNERLVGDYWWLTKLLWGMGIVGITPIALAQPAATGAMQAGRTVAAAGGTRAAVMRGAVGGAARAPLNAVTGGMGRRLGAIWVLGTIAAEGMKQRQDLLGHEIVRRFANGTLTLKQYLEALGDDANPPYRYFHAVR